VGKVAGRCLSVETANGYLGWRTAIDSDGRWLYFVAGD
jgi:hypothetical protein